MKSKTRNHRILIGLTMLFILAGIAACGITAQTEETPAEVQAASLLIVDEEGSTEVDVEGLGTAVSPPSSSGLTASEVEGLLFMREEEKLARDVYLTLYDEWGLNIFNNIASAEETHTDAVRVLLDQYGLDDPMTTDARGVFVNAELQALYDQLVAQGSQSLVDALRVGAAIEEIDILDLEDNLAQTENADIQMVYGNLLRGSRNHLRSFVRQIENRSGAYQPQYLSQAAYEAITVAGIETGSER
ncbi:MAG: DUF2202 domain-containing protein [Anaerolineales bacterium]|nr:DUF2202 domain-containing protein [Anaerolineales bacterium]